jgi:ribose 5-phosphate isomerase B
MNIYLGADHRGFQLKEQIKDYLKQSAYQIFDLGNDHYDPNDDYPDFASLVAQKVSSDPQNSVGILLCGSGVGIDVVANKFKRVRSALAFNPDQAFISRNDDNTNILSLAAGFIDFEEAKRIINIWLRTPFSGGERHKRRLKKIELLDQGIAEK